MHPAHCLNIRSSTAGSSWYVEVLKGTLFSEDRHWLETQSRGLVTCKTVRREKVHCGRTTLNVRCTTNNCTRLNDMIQLSHKLIAENKKDSKKEIVFQRLREAGRTSITEGDASAHFERSRWLSHRCSSSQTCMMTSQFRSATRITASTTSN